MRLGDLDALKEDLKQYFSDGTLDSVSAKLAFNMILRKIDNAPTVSERQQGKWVKIFENPFTNGYVCPFCGHKIQVTEQFLPKVTECESCGADMRGGAEE